MSSTITKRAVDLEPGDFIKLEGESLRCVVLKRSDSDGVDVRYSLAIIGEVDRTIMRWFPITHPMEVEAPTLTPAQQHAEELLALVRRAADDEKITGASQILLDKIDPPAPPTLEEALELLGEALDATRIGFEPLDRRISQFRDRARRSGVLKP